SALLGAWQRLELGAQPDQLSSQVEDLGLRIHGMLGHTDQIPNLKKWIKDARPSRVVGMLQFASAYNADWTRDIGQFDLPPILSRDAEGRLNWIRESSTSLAQADAILRTRMGITHDARLPLLAD